jgi:hypothetical protein
MCLIDYSNVVIVDDLIMKLFFIELFLGCHEPLRDSGHYLISTPPNSISTSRME